MKRDVKMIDASVIVPVYNSRDYIEECLSSLISQTLENIEIILVDDHGSDDSMEIARKVAEEYKGGKSFVFTQTPQNSGPGGARNVGISIAEGEYIAFVDSDDTVAPEFCEKLLDAAKTADADLVCCDISLGGIPHRNPETGNKKHFLTHFVSFFTTFIYRRSLLKEYDISFPDTKSAEDTCFLTCCILTANKTEQVRETMYHYRLHNDSVTRKKNRKRAFQRISSFKHLIAFARKHGFYTTYRKELLFITLKKGYVLALKDLILG